MATASRRKRKDAGVREAHRSEIVHDPGQQSRLVADRLEVSIVMAVDAVDDCRRRGVDHREWRLEFVRGVLEEASPGDLGGLEVRGHHIERSPERPDLVRPGAEPRTHVELAASDGGGRLLQPAEGAGQPASDGKADE